MYTVKIGDITLEDGVPMVSGKPVDLTPDVLAAVIHVEAALGTLAVVSYSKVPGKTGNAINELLCGVGRAVWSRIPSLRKNTIGEKEKVEAPISAKTSESEKNVSKKKKKVVAKKSSVQEQPEKQKPEPKRERVVLPKKMSPSQLTQDILEKEVQEMENKQLSKNAISPVTGWTLGAMIARRNFCRRSDNCDRRQKTIEAKIRSYASLVNKDDVDLVAEELLATEIEALVTTHNKQAKELDRPLMSFVRATHCHQPIATTECFTTSTTTTTTTTETPNVTVSTLTANQVV
jgi:hypothetical protein